MSRTITDGTQLHTLAWKTALALSGAVQSNPFGPDYEVFKVRGKVFMMTTEVRDTPVVTMKCGPEEGLALREEIATVTVGYHMNKRHWISVAAGPQVTERLLEELVENAYLLVVDKLTRTERNAVMDDMHDSQLGELTRARTDLRNRSDTPTARQDVD